MDSDLVKQDTTKQLAWLDQVISSSKEKWEHCYWSPSCTFFWQQKWYSNNNLTIETAAKK
jgi:hypothetical protein